MSKPEDQLPSIDPAALNNVTGGTVTSSSSDAMTQALTQILTSLQQLQSNQSQSAGGFTPETMMMFMMMMQQRNQGATAVAASPVSPYPWPPVPTTYY